MHARHALAARLLDLDARAAVRLTDAGVAARADGNAKWLRHAGRD